MKRKLFLLMIVLFMGLTSMKAQMEVIIGSGPTVNSYLPSYELYNYSLSQQIYTAEEIGIGGSINSISFNYAATSSTTRNLTIYMKHTTMSSFTTGTTWESVSASDIVFSGNLTYPSSQGWFEIPLNAPFTYNGTDNLLLCVDDNSGNWVGSKTFFAYTPEDGTSRSKSIYSDGVNYDPYNTSAYSGALRTTNNQIKLDMAVGNAPIVTVNPNPIAMGPRPNGAWMRPFNVSISNTGLPANLTAIEVSNSFFTLSDIELPTPLDYGDVIEFGVSTGETTAGEVAASLVVMYSERTVEMIDITATAYDPVCPDVWELAQTVSSYPYSNTPANIYDNYLLPGNVQDGPDAVYKMTFANDMLLTGAVIGENGKMALYAEDFGGEGGPGANNNYTGPTSGGGGGGGGTGGGDEFYYDFEDGTLSGWTTIDADGDGYNWVNGSTILTAGSGHNASQYCVLSQSYDNSIGVLYPDNYLVTPNKVSIANGSTFSFYACGQDASYAAEHYGVAISTTGNTNASDFTTIWEETLTAKGNPYKGSRGTRDQGTWYLKTIDLSDYAGQQVYIALRHFNCSDNYFLDVDDITLSAGRNANRDEVTLINEGFEGGAIPTGWSTIASSSAYWYVSSYSNEGYDPAHTGTYAAFCDGTDYNYDNAYLITPAIDLTGATSASLDYYYMNKAWASDVNGALVYYGTSATGPWTNLWSMYSSHSNWTNNTINLDDLCGSTVYIAFVSEDEYGYCTGFDDIVLTATTSGGGGGGGGGTATTLIENMTVPAGTYYLAASSTQEGFEVNIDAVAIPLPEPATCVYPADGATEIESPVTLSWQLGEYTTQYQLVIGTTYPPTEVLVDWTNELANSYTTGNLLNNKNYFWRVNEKNTTGTTTGTVWGFVTSLNVPQDLVVADNEIFEGENAVLSWTAVQDRSYRGYNVYQDGVKINDAIVTVTNYTVSGLSYNMAPGYTFTVTAVYDEGESPMSAGVRVFVSGNGTVSGIVYEQDGTTTVEGATVTFRGEDEFGDVQSFSFTTGSNGVYSGNILAGVYTGAASKDGYQDANYEGEVEIIYANETPDINFNLTENYTPVGEVIAEEVDDNMVKVYWSWDMMSVLIEDFETGGFEANPWDNTISSYPWAISTNNPYEGTYCMKSTCEGVNYGSSAIQITVEVPYNGLMSFYQLISSEQNYDKGHFYIDGVEKATASGTSAWTYKEFDVTEGEHTYKWEFTKDVSLGSGTDSYSIDYVTFYQQPEPWAGEGWIFYDDGVNVDAVGLTAGGSFYWGIMFPTATLQQYGNFSLTKVAYFDYGANTGTILIYEGGETAPGTLIHSQPYTATGSSAYIEFDLTSALPINNTQNLWIVMNNNDGQYVASASADGGDPNGRWISLDGVAWDDIVNLGLSYTWNIRGFITNARGQVMTLSASNNIKAIEYEGQSTPGGVLTTDPEAKTTVTNFGMNRGYDRSFNSYKLYRTDCYNEEYTEENTIVLASHVTDTVYMDMSWATAEPGVYKWGVAAYYTGNRESAITWNEGNTVVSEYAEMSPMAPVKSEMGNRAPWDLVTSFNCNGAGEQGIATDGNFIYTSSWSGNPGYGFGKYNMDGTFVEGFNISGVSGIRDLTYDGTYFYGGAGAATLYQIDLANKTLVSTINCSGKTIRHCSYDPVNDGFWLGNWSDLALVDRNGTTITAGPAPSSAYGSAYFTDEDGEAHLYLFCQPASDAKVYDYNITTGSFNSTPIFDFATLPGFNAGISGGAFVGVYNGLNCFFGNCQQDPNIVGIYELSTATAPGPGGNTGMQDPGESAIVWSNCLDKDMITTLDVAVSTNSGDSPAGTSVSFVNVSEPDMAISYEVELDETGIYAWDEVRKGTYVYTISLDGYNACAEADTIEIWDATSVECMLEEVIHSAGNLYVSPTGWAMWDGTGTSAPGGGGSGDTFTESWDAGLNGWTNIDGDSDGEVFYHSTECEPLHCVLATTSHSGAGHLCSESYCNCTGALNPNNFLVTPQKYNIGNGSVFSFYACAQDASYAAEHFGVAISTSGNTNAADFTTIQEWTLTAKGVRDAKAGTTRNGSNRAAGNWYQFTADLSAYAGQEVWIAIRHFNVSDQFIMCVDDAELASSRNTEAFEYYKVKLDGVFAADVNVNYYQHDATNLVEGQEYTTEVAAFYSTGMSAWSEYTWTYVPCENFNGVTDLAATPENGAAVLTWTMPNGGPTPPPSGGDTFFYDFEDGSLGDWTTIDADGDGINWLLGAAPGISGNNGSGYCVYSESYRSVPLTPDNYFVSKQVTIGSGATFEFYACAQDASYAAEHYGVAISTTGNTNAADFTTIWEETMTAKGQQGGPRENRVQGTWYHKSIDLSAYAGQQVYIAVRHFNCTDMFYIDIDDIELTCNTKANLEGSWLSYDDGVNVDGIGTGGSAVYWAVMFPSNMMSAYEGYSMTKVNLFDREAFSGDVMIYQGGATAPGTLVYTQDITMTGSNSDVDIVLNEPVALDVTQNVWVVMYCEFGGWPASCGANTGDPNGRWISLDGLQWDDVTSFGLDYTWNLRAYVEEGGVTPPTPGGSVIGAMVFRNGELLTPAPINASTYTDATPDAGVNEYCVRVVYGDVEFENDWYAMSCPECVDFEGGSACPAPEDLYGEYTWNEDGTYGATLTWPYEAPVGPVEEWLYYDNGTYASSVGAGGTVYWGISFDAADLTAYAGCSLTQVALYDAYAGTYTLNVYYGGTSAPATLVHTQNLTLTGINDWYYATLTAALPLDASQPLWITFYNSGVTYPAAGSNFTGDNNGAWVSIDGAEWMDLGSASGGSLSYTWMIRGFVTNQAKGGEIVALDAFNGEKSNSELSAIVVNPIVTEFAPVNRDVDHFNIYRSTTNGNYAVIGQVPATATTYFDDCTGTPDEYYYQVTAVYADGCESEPAMAYANPNDNYVVVDVTSVIENGIENVNIYPNPTNDKLNIEAAGMTRITVTSVLGQVIYDQAVASDNEVIDMNQYGAGVYMVRIVTEDGTMVKRITVID